MSVLDQFSLDGRTAPLDADLHHFTYRNLGHHLDGINLFSRIAADAKRRRGARLAALRMLIDPPAKFVKAYLLRGGFLDGMAGLLIAVMGAYSVFLKYAKLWELERAAAGGEG